MALRDLMRNRCGSIASPIVNSAVSDAAKAAAQHVATINGYGGAQVSTTLETRATGSQFLQTSIHQSVSLTLGRVLGGDAATSVQAAAFASPGQFVAYPVCIIILGKSNSDALDIRCGASLDAPDCKIKVNSKSNTAVSFDASTVVKVASIDIVGNYKKAGSASVTPTPVKVVVPMADPYANIPEPTNPTCGGKETIKDTDTRLSPQLAFCKGLDIKDAKVTFDSGVYLIDGSFKLHGDASIVGKDVTIFMRG